MKQLSNWWSVRSGDCMTVTGDDGSGGQTKLTGVTLIRNGKGDEAVDPGTGNLGKIAETKAGENWLLV